MEDIRSILNGDLSEVRAMIYDEDVVEESTGWRHILELFPTIFSRFSPMVLLMFFYSVIKLNHSKVYNYLLFLASFTPVVGAILVAGRTQIIYWVFIFGALYIYFRPYLNKSRKIAVLFPVLIAAGILSVYFLAVTASRWGESSDSSMTAYLGQSFLNFSYFFDHYSCREISFQRIFPFTYHFVLGQKFDLTDYRETIFAYSGENIGTNYKSFNGTGLSPAAVVSYHFGPYGLNLFYRYRYSWLRHEVTNDKNERIFAEKMRAETSEAEIMLARGLYRVKGVGLYGVFVSYAPYLDLRLHHLSSSPGWKRHYYGNAVSVAPYWGSYHFPLLAWIKYKKSNYNKGFSSQELSLGIDIWVGLF